MAQIDLTRKYSNFLVPKSQIIVGNEDITQKCGITATSLTVEHMPDASKLVFSVNDAQARWTNTSLFELNRAVEVKMGYGAALENIMAGRITTVKTVFSADHVLQIEVSGEQKPNTPPAVNSPICQLAYGQTLLSFTAIAAAEPQAAKVVTISRAPIINSPMNLHCSAECIGIPDIRAGIVVAIAGLGAKFNQNYLVEKAIHNFDGTYGFRTKFEAKIQPLMRKGF